MAEETETEVEARLREALVAEGPEEDIDGIDVVVHVKPHSQQPALSLLVEFPGVVIELRVLDEQGMGNLELAVSSFPEAVRQALEQVQNG